MLKKIIIILVFSYSFPSHCTNNTKKKPPQAPSHFAQNWKKYAIGATALGSLYYTKDSDVGKKVIAFFYTDKTELKKMCNNTLQTALNEQYYDTLFTAQECSTRMLDTTRTLKEMRILLNKIMFESNIDWKTQYSHALGRLITQRTPAVMQAASTLLYDTQLRLLELKKYTLITCAAFGSYKLQNKLRSWFTYYTVTQPLQKYLSKLPANQENNFIVIGIFHRSLKATKTNKEPTHHQHY